MEVGSRKLHNHAGYTPEVDVAVRSLRQAACNRLISHSLKLNYKCIKRYRKKHGILNKRYCYLE